MKRYRVKEIFRTLQGEGVNAGRTAIFVRFAGCNLWTGREKDRERDKPRGAAGCAAWCDTDFVDGEPMTAAEIRERVTELSQGDALLVITGGEPLLQLDVPLANDLSFALAARAKQLPVLALETNGTQELDPEIGKLLGHITVSPKVPEYELKLRRGHELRVPFPGLAPEQYEGLNFNAFYVSAIGHGGLAARGSLKEAAEFCLRNPRWRLSVQLHKVIGLP